MNQKKSIFISGAVCCIILVLLIFIGNLMNGEENIVPATDYEQLQLHVKSASDIEEIKIWKSEEDGYYFFLPAYADKGKVTFGNLQKEDRIVIGGNTYDVKKNILENIEFGTAYTMELKVNGQALSTQQVTFVKSANIPALFIDTESGTMESVHVDKELKEKATLAVVNAEGQVEMDGGIEYIKSRGNSTFVGFDKKSYQIKLFNNKALLGMDKAKKWILLANAQDDSLIRGEVVFDFAKEYTDVPSVDGVFTDVYLNGEYAGNYYLCEKLEVSENRLDIVDLEEKNAAANSEDNLENNEQYVSEDGKIRAVAGLKNPEDITGGYLLEKIIPDEYEACRSAFITKGDVYYRVVSPENATIEQVEYICGLFNELEHAINQKDGVNPDTGKHFSEYMDLDTWTDKYLMEEVFQDPDAPAASMFFYKDSDSVDPLIYSGPMWDYDRTLGGYAVTLYHIDDPKQIGYRGVYALQLLKHEEVMNMVLDKYQEYIVPYAEDVMSGKVHGLQKKLAASAKLNKIRWPKTQGYYKEWEANGDYLISFMENKVDFLNEVWLKEQEYHTVTFLDYYGNPCVQYEVRHGDYLKEAPAIATYVAVFSGWYSTETGKAYDSRLPVLEDATYESRWVDVSILVQNGLGAAELDAANVDIEALEMLIEELKRMQEETP